MVECAARVRMNVVAQTQRETATTRGPRRPRRRAAVALLLSVLIAGVALASIGTGQARPDRQPGTWCGGQLWRLMTLSDADRKRVRFDDEMTTVASLAKLTPPARISAARSSDFQRRIWRLRTVIDRYRVASNGEIVLILY